jgi:IS30 family transposase
MSNCYSQITLSERRRLFELRQRKVPLGDIARLMGRHRSTIYREIKRNSFRDTEIPDYNGYHSVVADNISKDRRTRLRKLRRYQSCVSSSLNNWKPIGRRNRSAAD